MRKILFFISFLSFIACNKEANDSECGDPTLIRQIKMNNYDIQQIIYNGSCQVKESIEPIRYNNYIYNDQNQLVKIEEKMSFDGFSCYMPTGLTGESFTDPRKAKIISYITIDYTQDGLINKKSQYFNYSDTYKQVSYELYKYQGSQVVKIESYDNNNKLVDYTLYDYDEKGNVQSTNFFLIVNGAPILKQSLTYQYDNKLNPFKIFSFDGLPGTHTNLNNIISEKRITYNAGNKLEYSTNYTLEYNDLGYPSKVNDKMYVYGK